MSSDTESKKMGAVLRRRILADMATLYATAVQQINAGERTFAEIDAFLRSGELFITGELGTVAPSVGVTFRDDDPAPSDPAAWNGDLTIFNRLAMDIELDAALRRKLRVYLVYNRGILLVGEWLSLRVGKKQATWFRELTERLRAEAELPADLRPVDVGWRPPYWDEKWFNALLPLRCFIVEGFADRSGSRGVDTTLLRIPSFDAMRVLGFQEACHRADTEITMGEFFRLCPWTTSSLEGLQGLARRLKKGDESRRFPKAFRGGLIMPPAT